MTYPDEAGEVAMLRLAHRGVDPATLADVVAVAGPDELRAARDEVDATTVSDDLLGYVAAIVRRTRTLPSVALGASPRAAVHLLAASKAAARLAGRGFVTPDDVVSHGRARVAPPVAAPARGRARALPARRRRGHRHRRRRPSPG